MTKTTREEELRMTLGNFATCRDSIGEDEEEFDARISMAFGGRDKSKRQIDDLTDRAVSDIKSLLEKEREGYLTSKGNAEMSRDARARLGLTQIEMAKRLGISTIQLAKVEGGDRGFSKKVLIKLSILKGKK